MRKVILLVGLCNLVSVSQVKAKWHMFKYNESRTGFFLAGNGEITSPEVKWQKRLDAIPSHLGDHVHCSAAIGDVNGDGKLEIIVGTEECDNKGGGIWCLQGKDGSECWFKQLTAYIHNSSPALGDVDGDGKLEVVIGTGFGGSPLGLYALNGEDGSELWFQNIGGVESSPNLGDIDSDGKLEVIVGADNGNVYALNGENGSVIWTYSTGYGNVRCCPALADIDDDGKLEVVFQTTTVAKILALNGEDGSVLWTHHITNNGVSGWGEPISTPAIADINQDGKLEVVVGCCNDSVYALNAEDGNQIWAFGTNGRVFSSPVVGDIDQDGKIEVVIGSEDSTVYALNGEDGTLLWSFPTERRIFTAPVLVDIDDDGKIEVIVNSFTTFNGPPDYLYTINGEDGSLCWSWQFPNLCDHIPASPVVSDIDNDGKIEIVIGSGGHTTEEAFIYVLDQEGEGVQEPKDVLLQKELFFSNYPNPFKSHTEFNFGVSEGVNVNFVIYNLAGEKVRSLINNKYFESGSYNFYWDARDDCGRRLSAGVYLYVFELKSKNETKRLVEKIVLLK